MPDTLAQFIWIFGVALVATLGAVTGFFFIRLIKGLDNFEKNVTGSLKTIGENMSAIHHDLDARVKVIEVAGCLIHRHQRAADINRVGDES
jgi:hypothetical protein